MANSNSSCPTTPSPIRKTRSRNLSRFQPASRRHRICRPPATSPAIRMISAIAWNAAPRMKKCRRNRQPSPMASSAPSRTPTPTASRETKPFSIRETPSTASPRLDPAIPHSPTSHGVTGNMTIPNSSSISAAPSSSTASRLSSARIIPASRRSMTPTGSPPTSSFRTGRMKPSIP